MFAPVHGTPSVHLSVTPLVALLADCDKSASCFIRDTSTLTLLTQELIALTAESVARSSALVQRAVAALASCAARVCSAATRVDMLRGKAVDAELETGAVTAKQLRGFAASLVASPDLPPFEVLHLLGVAMVVGVARVGVGADLALACDRALASVTTGDGAHVRSADGPGLQRFNAHTRNEFTVVLAQSDGATPMWLTDHESVIVSIAGIDRAAAARGYSANSRLSSAGHAAGFSESSGGMCTPATAVGMRQFDTAACPALGFTSVTVSIPSPGVLSVVYCVAADAGDVDEVELRLWVSGVQLTLGPVDSGSSTSPLVWVVRRFGSHHTCAAVGTHVRTVEVVRGKKTCMAVSTDEKVLVVGCASRTSVVVYALPDGAVVRSFGGTGSGPLHFGLISAIAFSPAGTLIVAGGSKPPVQEVTAEGEFVRFIGAEHLAGLCVTCAAVHARAVATAYMTLQVAGVMLFDFDSGALLSNLMPEQSMEYWHILHLAWPHDGCQLIYKVDAAKNLSVLTLSTATGVGSSVGGTGTGVGSGSGTLEATIAANELSGGHASVAQASTGEYVLSDRRRSTVFVLSADGSTRVRTLVLPDTAGGRFKNPIAVAMAGPHLYVLEEKSRRVLVFL